MDLAVTEHGPATAPSVVLLHGLGTTGWMWDRVLPHVADELHCLVVDLPGHGGSNRRPWRSVRDTVDAVAEVVRARAHGGTASAAGLSLGGYVAAVLAAERPDLAPSALVSGVSVLPFPRPRLLRATGLVLAPLLTTGPALRANARALKVPDEDLDAYVAAGRTMARGTYRRVGGELLGSRVPAGAERSTCRLLAVAGDREHELIRRSVPLLAAAFPRGAGRLVPGLGHAWVGEDPASFAAVLTAHVGDEALPGGLLQVDGGTTSQDG